MDEMVSFGAGVNSTAMVITLAEEGWRGPIVFADTMGEKPETYCYMDYFEREYLKPRGLAITRLLPGDETTAKPRKHWRLIAYESRLSRCFLCDGVLSDGSASLSWPTGNMILYHW